MVPGRHTLGALSLVSAAPSVELVLDHPRGAPDWFSWEASSTNSMSGVSVGSTIPGAKKVDAMSFDRL